MGQPARLAEEQLRTLDRLSGGPEIGKFYLAGGTPTLIVRSAPPAPTAPGS